jgi:hypothetical protein
MQNILITYDTMTTYTRQPHPTHLLEKQHRHNATTTTTTITTTTSQTSAKHQLQRNNSHKPSN